MEPQYIQVPITEYDLELFKKLVYSGEEFVWSFETNKGTTINVEFRQEED